MTGRVGRSGNRPRRPRRGRLYSVRGTAGSGAKPTSRQLADELLRGQEALRLAGELGEDERLAGDRRGRGRKGVAREGEDEERGAGSRDPRGLAERRRNSAAERARFQMPCAMTRSQLPSASGSPVHGGEREAQLPCGPPPPPSPPCRCAPAAAASIGSELSRPTTFQPRSASGTALRPAPQPRSSARRRRAAALGATRAAPFRRSASGPGSVRSCAKPATTDGALQGESAGEVMPVT